MKISRTIHALIFSGLVFFGSFASAQSPDGKPQTDKEKEQDALKTIGAMNETVGLINKMIEQARADKDVLKLNCVNERRSQILGLMKTTELFFGDLQSAEKDRQSETVDNEYTKIKKTKEKLDGYYTEARQCIGTLAFYEGGNQAERTFTDNNTDSSLFDPINVSPVTTLVFRPPAASPK